MKPSSFDYLAPADLDGALGALAGHSGEAKLLAGGQSLVPAMNFRLATPSLLIDLNRIEGLDRVYVDGDEYVIQALVRHRDLEAPVTRDPAAGLLARLSHFVGHLPIRVRGTFAGSLAHADPAAEWCMLALALDATIVARSVRGPRNIPAAEFFEGLFTTALATDEVITEVRLPRLINAGTGFREKSQTAGDFATVATVAAMTLAGGSIAEVRLALAGAGPAPVRAARAESLLVGERATAEALAAAAHAAAEDVDPPSDPHCSADYRRHLVEVLSRRVLADALEAAS
ncbi:MAG: FAD binding domain-containing protein [Actinomycetota bacterium]